MRRCFAGALLLIFLAQSSGMAVARTISGPSRNAYDIGAVLAAIETSITSSLLFAVATGTEDRYAAMHAPPPHTQRPAHSIDGRAVMRARKVLRPQPRPGRPERLQLPPRSVLTSRDRPRDPRAMRRSTIELPTMHAPEAVQGAAPKTASELLGKLTLSPGPQNVPISRGRRGSGVKPLTSVATGAGIQHWWSYEEQPVPGIGRALLNVGTGNLLVSAMDVNVPEQGINLVFQRVYNSQSVHDVNGDDGGDPAIFGNGWTNNFDASIVYNGNVTPATITVYDLNGTACVYTADGNGGWAPCTGEYAKLAPVQNSQGCSYTWTKPNGTVYFFQSDGGNTGFCTGQYLAGHLREIVSRNSNNYITFTYSWDSSGIKTSEHITQIVATHSDGDTLVMAFGIIAGTYNELSTITRPDNSVLQYWYDQNGNLVEVDKPGNNSGWQLTGNPHGQSWQKGDLPETYAYIGSTSQMQEACGPRCTAGMWANSSDGAALVFQYTNGQLTQWQVQGVLNFVPDDSSSPQTKLQSGVPIGWQDWNTTTFLYGTTGICGNPNNNVTYMCDQDGHGTKWTTDGSGRVTQTSRFAVNQWITTTQTWDGANNLLYSTDANNNTTQYGYDASGNVVEMQQPNATDFTLNGVKNQSLYPLSTYSYDANNNIVAYCDPVWNYTHNIAWNPNPSDSLCQSTQGTTYFTYDNDQANEPFGCLTDMYKPGGYHTKIKYGTPPGSDCNNGLPSQVQGDVINQFGNNPSRQPTQDFGYNSYGQLHTYDRGPDGSDNFDSWTLTYNQNNNHDNLNTQRVENDSTISPNNMKSFTCYYPDGSVFYTETPQQHVADGNLPCPMTASLLQESANPTAPSEATSHYYDYDGDEIRSTTYKGCIIANQTNSCSNTDTNLTRCSSTGSPKPIGTTCKYYDGLDRLVETAQPYDDRSFTGKAYEAYAFRWMNRYIYDLSLQGSQASLTIADQTGSTYGFAAYGNLYKTEEYLPQLNSNMHGCVANTNNDNNGAGCTAPNNNAKQYTSGSWSDVRGTSFDSMDRPVGKYELAYGHPHNAVTTNSYDASGQAGLLSSVQNAVSQTTTYFYDGISRVQNIQFSSGDGDNRSYQYDPDGRTASIKGDAFGTISYTYDLDGNEQTVTEPTNGPQGWTAGSFICYEYYPDGLREYLTIGDASQGYTQCSGVPNEVPSNGGISQYRLFSYAYAPDNRLVNEEVKWGSQNDEVFQWAYKPSGREKTETDPLNQQIATAADGTTRGIGTKQYTYDSYGRVNGLTLPGGYQEARGSVTYDLDDELAGYTAGNGVTRNMILNARGELISDSTAGDLFGFGTAQGATQSANGIQIGYGNHWDGQNAYQIPPTTLEYDLRSNMVTCSTDPNFALNYSNSGKTWPYVYKYDGAGRQTGSGVDQTVSGGLGDTSCDQTQATNTSTYDAENHIITSSIYQASGTATWGPDGRQRVSVVQVQPGQGNLTETAHWDGDSLLFATGGNNTPQLYIGKFGVMDRSGGNGTPGDLDVYDRDQTGAEVSSHGQAFYNNRSGWMTNGYWIDGWSIGSVRTLTSYKGGQQIYLQLFKGTCNGYFTQQGQQQPSYFQCPATTATFEMTRADGYKMVGGFVQGARTFDSTSGQWVTPDPYAGNVVDPLSQKPFIWNGNNPLQFNDPTGYTIDWSTVPDDELEEITNLRIASPTFDSELTQMEDSSNVYKFTSTDTLGANILGEFDPNNETITTLSGLSGYAFDSVIAHEVAHATDDAEGVYDVLSGPPSLPESTPSKEGEANTDEEAHGYMMEFKVLSEAFGSQKATGMMKDQMPNWGGAAGSQPWTMDQITQKFCASMPGWPSC